MSEKPPIDKSKQVLHTDTKVRIDKWLWAVRIYKTRSQASEACKSGRVKFADEPVKPSRIVAIGDEFTVRKGLVTHRFKVLLPLGKRVGAKLVEDYRVDLTPDEELEKLRQNKLLPGAFRLRGTGRPTKKERRNIDKWQEKGGGSLE